MHVIMYAMGAIFIAGAFVEFVISTDNVGLLAFYLRITAVSTAVAGLLFLGFGAGLQRLKEIAENTRPLRDLVQRAAARAAGDAG